MEKALDRQGRWRSKTVAFRVSPEENNQIEIKVRLSGLTKQDYIVSRLTDREIRVVGNPRVYKALKNQMADIEWEQLGTHEEHLSVLDYKKQERAKEVRALDTTIAEKQTQVDEIEQTLQSVQKQVIDIDKIENISVKKALLSDKVTLPRNDFDNLLNAAKQYVVYRRQDDRLQGLLDAANDKIKQLEGVIGELKQKVSKLVSKLSNIEFWHSQELNEVKSESRE